MGRHRDRRDRDAPRRRRSSPGCRRDGRSRPTAAGRRSGSRSASRPGTAAAAAGRSSAPSASPSRPERALPAEEGPGDLPGRVVALLDVDRQRQEVDVAQVADRRGGRAPSCRRTARRRRRSPAGRACRSRRRSPCRLPPARRGSRQTCSSDVFPFGRPDGGHRSLRTSRSRSRAMLQSERTAGRLRPRGGPSTKTAGVPVTPARIPPSKVAAHALGDRVRPTVAVEALEVEPQFARPLPQVRDRPTSALVGVDRVDQPPRSRPRRPAAPPPRPRREAPARAGACWRPGSGGTPGAAAAREIRGQVAAQCGQARSR